MEKQGPCYHCGVTSTPLWRNGPPEKPVLCNACGSRWRTKGSLTNYTPLHARGELLDSECAKIPRPISMPIKKDLKLHKRTYDVIFEVEGEASNADQNFQKLEEDSSNRSSSRSAVSYSESCAHFGAAEANEMTVGAQSTAWDSLVPSRKRSCIGRPKQSPVEKLTKELQRILDEQRHLFLVSASSEEELLLESRTLVDSLEMGHGGCLLKYSNLESGEQESEASSFSVDNKYQYASDVYSSVSSLSAVNRNEMMGLPSIENERAKKLTVIASQENRKRDKNSLDEFIAIVNDTSLLTTVDLRDVVNHEVFMTHLTSEEHESLMKDLPSLEGDKPLDRFYNNAYYAKIGGMSKRKMNCLEVDFLFGLGFHLNVTPKTFNFYCSHLQREMLLDSPPETTIKPELNHQYCSFSEDDPNLRKQELAV